MTDVADAIERHLNARFAIWPFSGAVSVTHQGTPIFEKAYGMASHEFAIRNTVETRFALGSLSKQFTSFAVLQLHDRGLLDIDAPVNTYLPGDLEVDPRITAHHLLSHTSGLHNFCTFEEDFFQGYDRTQYSKLDFFHRYVRRPPIFEPGSQYEYANSGYNLLAWVVESTSGRLFCDYLQEYIFGPLGMRDTTQDEGTSIIPNLASAYTWDRDAVVRSPYFNQRYSIGAGGIVSTCADLHRWYRCLKTGGLVTRATHARFLSENLKGYCYGLKRDAPHRTVRYAHGGDHLGLATHMQDFFDHDTCIIVLSNDDCTDQYRMGAEIGDLVFTAKASLPTRWPELAVPEEIAREYEGVYLERKIELRRHGGAWEFVRFDGNLRIAIHAVGEHRFVRTRREQTEPYVLTRRADGAFEFFGYGKRGGAGHRVPPAG